LTEQPGEVRSVRDLLKAIYLTQSTLKDMLRSWQSERYRKMKGGEPDGKEHVLKDN